MPWELVRAHNTNHGRPAIIKITANKINSIGLIFHLLKTKKQNRNYKYKINVQNYQYPFSETLLYLLRLNT